MYRYKRPPQGDGADCDEDRGATRDCDPGVDSCPDNVDCEGEFGRCNAQCRKDYSFTVNLGGISIVLARNTHENDCCRNDRTTLQQGDGAPCPHDEGSFICDVGDGDCADPENPKQDCVGEWSTCSASCVETCTMT